jgi:cell fate (sporulation/competence/biofilm development) regulator YmcA (YheA/YmcA/DUF963 family)
LQKGIKADSNAILKYRLVPLLIEQKRQREAYELLALALMQNYDQVDFLFEMEPKLKENKKVNMIVEDFKSYYRK